MTDYFSIDYSDDDDLGTAEYDPEKEWQYLPQSGPVRGWQVPVFRLAEAGFADFLSNDVACHLCSDKLRKVLDRVATSADDLQWLPARVLGEGGEERAYFVLHFPNPANVLDSERSATWAGSVTKPVFARDRLAEHSVFTYPGASGFRLFVSDVARAELGSAGCTGMAFAKARVYPPPKAET